MTDLPSTFWVILRIAVAFTTFYLTAQFMVKLVAFHARGVRGLKAEFPYLWLLWPALCWSFYIVCFN